VHEISHSQSKKNRDICELTATISAMEIVETYLMEFIPTSSCFPGKRLIEEYGLGKLTMVDEAKEFLKELRC
jgi:hypothetical protein